MSQLQGMILVRCQRCTRRLGNGTRLGEMVLFPDEHGGRWGWLPWGRQRDRDGQQRQARALRRKSVDVQFSGGVEVRCRRCEAAPRLTIKTLANLAATTHAAGASEIVI